MKKHSIFCMIKGWGCRSDANLSDAKPGWAGVAEESTSTSPLPPHCHSSIAPRLCLRQYCLLLFRLELPSWLTSSCHQLPPRFLCSARDARLAPGGLTRDSFHICHLRTRCGASRSLHEATLSFRHKLPECSRSSRLGDSSRGLTAPTPSLVLHLTARSLHPPRASIPISSLQHAPESSLTPPCRASRASP